MKYFLHTLPALTKPKKRRGRGVADHGAKSGRGMKGQRSRAGSRIRAGFEGGQTPLYQRLPKGRGVKQIFTSQVRKPAVVNVAWLNRCKAKAGSVVGLGVFRETGVISRNHTPVKLVGGGKLDRSLTVRVHMATKVATQLVEEAGGKVEIIT